MKRGPLTLLAIATTLLGLTSCNELTTPITPMAMVMGKVDASARSTLVGSNSVGLGVQLQTASWTSSPGSVISTTATFQDGTVVSYMMNLPQINATGERSIPTISSNETCSMTQTGTATGGYTDAEFIMTGKTSTGNQVIPVTGTQLSARPTPLRFMRFSKTAQTINEIWTCTSGDRTRTITSKLELKPGWNVMNLSSESNLKQTLEVIAPQGPDNFPIGYIDLLMLPL